ncbi:MAG: hypothetical protein D6706_18525 [Chloroflexi bacterium]|nr:MAG: hypothetical protein D6706_18525 [Chloroflexota bacterium]
MTEPVTEIDLMLKNQPHDNASLNDGLVTFTSRELGKAWGLSARPVADRIRSLVEQGVLKPAFVRRVNMHGFPHKVRGYIYMGVPEGDNGDGL